MFLRRSLLLGVALLVVGCSGRGNSPVAPHTPTDDASISEITGPLAIATGGADGVLDVSQVLSVNTLTIRRNPDGSPSADLTPMRIAAAKGDAYELDATGFFTESPCKDCLKVTGLSFDPDGAVVVDLSMKHPFALPTPPYTLASRLDLHAFDVMGFIVTEGIGSPVTIGGGTIVASNVLKNADGYTNLYDAVLEPYLPTPNVNEHPYKMFFRDDQQGNFAGTNTNGFADPAAPQGQNTMAMGESDEVSFTLDLPPGASELSVGFAIGLSWGQGAQGKGANVGQRQQPIYYLPEFHHKAPWTVTANLTDNNLEAGNTASSATIEVHLRDWQRGATVAAGSFDFGITPPDQVRAASDLASLTITAPGLLAAPLNLDPNAPSSGTGLYDDAVWSTLITNALDAPEGQYYAWVKATDQLAPTPTSGLDRTINFFTVSDFHTGFLLPIAVGDIGNTPPTAALAPNPATGSIGHPVDFDASASTDLETPGTLQYEFDFDLVGGDPLNFTADTAISSTPTASYIYCPVGSYTAAVRVTDDSGATNIATVPVTITNFNPQTPVMVLAANSFSQQTLSTGNFSGDSRLAVAGDHVVALVFDNATTAEDDYAHRLYISDDGGATWQAGAVLDQTYTPAGTPSVYPWGDQYVVLSPDGTVYTMGQQARPDFTFPELRIWTSGNFGADPWIERFLDPGYQKYSLTGAVDPNDPGHVILSYSIGTCNFGTVQTSTGSIGLTTGPQIDGGCNGGFGASLFFAPNNRVYHCSIRFGAGPEGGMWVHRSDNGGATWGNLFVKEAGSDYSTVFGVGHGMADFTDPSGLTFAYGCRFNNNPSLGTALFTSTDGGQNITYQTNIGPSSGDINYSGARYYPNGELMVYWANSSTFEGVTSCDNGASFSTFSPISTAGFNVGAIVPDTDSPDMLCLSQAGFAGQINFRRF